MSTPTQNEQNDLKQALAKAALEHIPERCVLGVGHGTTIDCLIALLPSIKARLEVCVASSEHTAQQLRALHIPVADLNGVPEVHLYIDSADACNMHGQLIKGGGGALTREKILATAAREFLCLIDETKLGTSFIEQPIPIEVIPMARGLVARALVKMGGQPEYRQNFTTDNQNIILDTHHLSRHQPIQLEHDLKQLTGVVESGLFAERRPNQTLVAYFGGKIAPL